MIHDKMLSVSGRAVSMASWIVILLPGCHVLLVGDFNGDLLDGSHSTSVLYLAGSFVLTDSATNRTTSHSFLIGPSTLPRGKVLH